MYMLYNINWGVEISVYCMRIVFLCLNVIWDLFKMWFYIGRGLIEEKFYFKYLFCIFRWVKYWLDKKRIYLDIMEVVFCC